MARAMTIFRQKALEKLSSPEQLDYLVKITRPRSWVALSATIVLLALVIAWAFLGSIPDITECRGIFLNAEGVHTVTSTVTGEVVDIRVEEGDLTEEGTTVAWIRPINADYTEAVLAPGPGVVAQVVTHVGATVTVGESLMNLVAKNEDQQLILYIPVDLGKKVRPGMDVRVSPSTVNEQEYGRIIGHVTRVDKYTSTPAQMEYMLGNKELVKTFEEGTSYQLSPIRADVTLERDPQTISGYRWTSRLGPPFEITVNTVCTAEIVTGQTTPIDLVIPSLEDRLGVKPP